MLCLEAYQRCTYQMVEVINARAYALLSGVQTYMHGKRRQGLDSANPTFLRHIKRHKEVYKVYFFHVVCHPISHM